MSCDINFRSRCRSSLATLDEIPRSLSLPRLAQHPLQTGFTYTYMKHPLPNEVFRRDRDRMYFAPELAVAESICDT